MILLSGLVAAGRRAVESVWGWRMAEFGPPTAEYRSTVTARTEVDWGRWGLSARCYLDEDSATLHGCVGPLGGSVMLGRSVDLSRFVTSIGGRQVHLYVVPMHLGAVIAYGRAQAGWALSGEFGPVGVLVEPQEGTDHDA